jgi:hypothetical protein
MNSKITRTKGRGRYSLRSAGLSGRSVRSANLSNHEETWGTVHEIKGGAIRFHCVLKWGYSLTISEAKTFKEACRMASEHLPYKD